MWKLARFDFNSCVNHARKTRTIYMVLYIYIYLFIPQEHINH